MEAIHNSTLIHQRYQQNGNHLPKDKQEVIYCSPLIDKQLENEKYAVKLITERYDSLRYLGNQMDALQIADSTNSIALSSVDGSSSRYGSSTTDEGQDAEYAALESQTGELADQDIAQIEVFFCSHKTHVYVCRCLANLYFTTLDSSDKPTNWELARTGVPVILLDKGETRARDKRMLQIVLAEKGSGFVLWKDVIDNLSNYRAEDATFHTMYLSSDHRKMAGLSYDVAEAAEAFMGRVEELTSDPLNISLSVPKQKRKKSKSQKKEKQKPLRKCDISKPCIFEHVTSVALDDKKRLYSMATLVSPGETG